MDALDLKAILLTWLAIEHFNGDVLAAAAAVRQTELQIAEQANAVTEAAIAAEQVLDTKASGTQQPLVQA